jgi:cytochrome c
MRRVLFMGASIVLLAAAALPALAEGSHGNADEAKAMVVKAAAYLKEVGAEKAFAAFNDKSNPNFHDRDLYIFVRGMDGNTVAHGANAGMIGHTSLELKDADGKLYNKEMIELAQSKGSGWVDYRWVNPMDKKIEQKSSYIEKVGDYVVGAGFYKQ